MLTLSEQNEIDPINDIIPLRTNIFLHSGISLFYNIKEQVRFSIGLSGEYMLKSMFKQEKQIKRKFLYYSTKIGVEYLF